MTVSGPHMSFECTLITTLGKHLTIESSCTWQPSTCCLANDYQATNLFMFSHDGLNMTTDLNFHFFKTVPPSALSSSLLKKNSHNHYSDLTLTKKLYSPEHYVIIKIFLSTTDNSLYAYNQEQHKENQWSEISPAHKINPPP